MLLCACSGGELEQRRPPCTPDGYCEEGYLCSPDNECVVWAETPCGDVGCGDHGTCALTVAWAPLCLCEDGFHPVDGGCAPNDAADPCAGVTCDGEGTCAQWYDDPPYCDCGPGTHASSLHCVPNDPTDPCRGVPCGLSGGTCEVVGGEPLCECFGNTEPLGQYCLSNGTPAWVAQELPMPLWGGLTFDASRQQPVMFEGQDLTPHVRSASGWLALPTANDGPSPRRQAASTYDATRSRHVLFGGWLPNDELEFRVSDETWAFDTDWWLVPSAETPPARYDANLGYDRQREVVVLMGGIGTEQRLDDTWILDGAGWHALPADPVPSCYNEKLVWNPEQECLWLVQHCSSDLEIRSFEGDHWELQHQIPAPMWSFDTVGYDWRRSRLLFFYFDDVWVLHGETLFPDPPLGEHGPTPQNTVWDPSTDQLLVWRAESDGWGGTWGTVMSYRWFSRWPDEACDDGLDNDHDGYVDGDDPECP